MDIEASPAVVELVKQQFTSNTPDVDMPPAASDGDEDDLLPPMGPNGDIESPLIQSPTTTTVAPPIPPVGLFEPETPFLSLPSPVQNTPPDSIDAVLPMDPSVNLQLEGLKTALEKCQAKNSLLVAKLRKERVKFGRLQSIVSHLEDLDHIAMDEPPEDGSRWKKRKTSNVRFHGLIHAAIDLVVQEDRNFCRWKESCLTKELSFAFSTYASGVCDNELTILYKEKIRKRYFNVFEILRAMDLAGGVCSYTAYDIIRSVVLAVDKNNDASDDDETTDSTKRTGLCLMPSTSELKRAAKFVEKVGQTVVPLIHQPDAPFGKAIQFKYEETFKFLLQSFSLYGTDCTIAHSLDGAQLSKRELHTCAGIKIIDQKAIDPRTGSLMFEDPKDAKFQGLNHLFPMKMVMARETNNLVYQEFGDFYSFCQSCEHDESNPYAPYHPKLVCTAECDCR
jgi:hypothetical protein